MTDRELEAPEIEAARTRLAQAAGARGAMPPGSDSTALDAAVRQAQDALDQTLRNAGLPAEEHPDR